MRDKSLDSGERQHWFPLEKIEMWHRWRYYRACRYVEGKKVLDLGCGVGYGSSILSVDALSVIGLDDSEEAVKFANKYYKKENVFFQVQDITDFEKIFFDNKADVIIGFEIIEHLEKPDAFFDLCKLMQPELVMVSVPHIRCPISGNKFHKKHYGFDELIDLFWGAGYKPKEAQLMYFGTSLTNFMIMERI